LWPDVRDSRELGLSSVPLTAEGVREARVEENQEEIQARLSQLENIRILLEEARVHARQMGSPEGDRIEGQIRATLREVSRQIFDLRASQP
jgi:hypothetical protein